VDYSRTSNNWSIPGSDDVWFSVSSIEDFDAAMDRVVLAVWSDGTAEEPSETFSVNRNGPGWELLRSAIFGRQRDIAAAYQWWTAIRDTPLVAAHRVLDAIDNVHRCSPGQLAEQLGVPACEVEPASTYGQMVEALVELRLVSINIADSTFGLTRSGQRILHPDAPSRVDQGWLREALASKLAQNSPSTRLGQAFPPPRAAVDRTQRGASASTPDQLRLAHRRRGR
jgi:hypothetical protein